MPNTFGKLYKITTWGESHGDAVGVTIDGCPPGINITNEDIQFELNRRKPGQSEITTQRKESDLAEILSGTFEGKTLGSPIHISVINNDAKSKDYDSLKDLYRPSHADYTYDIKYGIRNWKGGGRASARETIGRVAAGAIAKKILKQKFDIDIVGYVKSIQNLTATVDTNTSLPAGTDFSKMNVSTLKGLAKKAKITGYSSLKKAALISALENHLNQ